MPRAKTPRKRRRKPGDLAALRRVLWEVLARAEAIATDEHADPDVVLKGAHACASLAGVYLRTVEAHELVPRLEAVEAALAVEDRP